MPARAFLLALLAVACAAVLAAAAPAGATSLLTCPAGSETNTYNPGLRLLTTQSVTATIDIGFGTCASTDPTIGGATPIHVSRSSSLSCTSLLSPPSGPKTVTYTWDNGQTSDFTYTNSANTVAGVLLVTGTGTITAGEFSGASGVSVAALPALPLDCLTATGLTSETGTFTLALTGP